MTADLSIAGCCRMEGVLCVVVVMGLGVHGWKTEYTVTGRAEGEECDRQAGQVWTCKKAADCKGLQDILKTNNKLRTCSWNGPSPILCCPPLEEPDRVQISKCEKKCAEYEGLLCSDQDGYFLGSVPQPESLQRRRRQDVGQPDLETTTFDPSPLYVAGGRLTRPRELPIMVEDEKPIIIRTQVFGGQIARPRANPHMALIGYGDAGAISWQCGGSLVSDRFVLSAAHCVNTPYGLARWVRLGDLDLKSDTEEARPQQLEIVERVVHPGYHSPAFYNDLALFRLDRVVVFDHFVRPACLYTDTKDPSGVGIAAGWGKNESHGPRSSALMQVDISFVPGEECKQVVGVIERSLPNGVDTDSMVCAGEYGKDTCQGDSGGPLVLPSPPGSYRQCLARLVGVTSFGPKNCGRTSVPGAYVRVAHFLPWIESVVWPD